MKQIFERIIKNHYWRDHLCGTGSTEQFTAPLRSQLGDFLERHGISSMLDAPCGDYSWMSITKLPDNFRYIGADIVDFMIKNNQQQYPDVDFRTLDISTDKLPDVDVLFCRDCLIHFSNSDIVRTFKNIVNSNIRYVMLTTYDDSCFANHNINTGEFRPISFTQEPYNLGTPVDVLLDWVPGTANQNQIKYIALWPVESLKTFLSQQ